MRFHPRVLHFGRLDLVEVYEFYDRPLLVCCRSAAGTLYLAVMIDDGEDGTEAWLYVSVSEERFKHVRSGAIDLHDAFKQAEDGVAFEVTIPHGVNTPVLVAPLPVSDLSDEMLPAPGRRIELPTGTPPQFDSSLDAEASRTRRDMLRLSFELSSTFRSEAPARFVGQVLTAVQEAVNAISQFQQERASGRSDSLKKGARKASELAVLAFGAGSFEIKLASADSADPSGTTQVTEPLREFLSLLQLGSQAQPLQERLARLPARIAGSYLKFLKALDDRIEHATAEWASPSLKERGATVTLSAVTVHTAISAFKSQTFETTTEFDVAGRLVGASLDKRTFELRFGRGKHEVYTGQITPEATRSVEGAVIGEHYLATLQRTQKVKITTGEVIETLRLLDLRGRDSQESLENGNR